MAAGVGWGIRTDNKFRFIVHVDFQVDCECFFLMVQLWLSLLLVLWFVSLFAGVVFVVIVAVLGFVFLVFLCLFSFFCVAVAADVAACVVFAAVAGLL